MKRSWVEADFFCQALGAQLCSFYHSDEERFVKQLLSTMFEGLVRLSEPHSSEIPWLKKIVSSHCVLNLCSLFCISPFCFRTVGRSFWVGLNKRDPQYLGSWMWSDGSPVRT